MILATSGKRRIVGLLACFTLDIPLFAASALGVSPDDPVHPASTCVPRCESIQDLRGSEATLEVEGLADLIRGRVESAASGLDKIEILNRLFFGGLKFRAQMDQDSRESIFPADVLRNRSGSCIGLTGVYLSTSLQLPVSAVAVPGHLFVRFDDSHIRINVELLQAGKPFDDDWYIRNHRIPEISISSGVFLKSLTTREFFGYVYANLGAAYSRAGDLSNSQVLYEAALRNTPLLPVAYYNLANDFLNQRSYRHAVESYNGALHLYPTDVMALNNRGIAFCRLGKARRARRDFQEALDLDPSFTQARANLADLDCSRTQGPKQ